MEPSGLMDNKSLHDFKQAHFVIHDAADEEVHFSREVLGQEQPFNIQRSLSLGCPGSTRPTTFSDINLINQMGPTGGAAADQAKSSRILNTIGLKLRRGSNYLVAPSLVGQYLLGITIQSWTEFFSTSHMMKVPSNTQHLTRRILANLAYFQGNYLCVSLVLIIYCILTSPFLLLAIISYLLAMYLVTARSALGKPLQVLSFRPNLQQQYSFISLISVPLLWIAGAPSAVFWVIGASFVVVGLHASMYSSDRDQPSNTIENSHANIVQSYYNHHNYPMNQSGHLYLSLPTSRPATRLSDVNTISQDYAGLGRVYEV